MPQLPASADPASPTHPLPERSLDPDDWESARRLGHRMIDDMLDHLRTVRLRPVWQPPSPGARRSYGSVAPEQGSALEAVYAEFQETILPYSLGNTHPRFWGWICGTGTVGGMLADLLASGMNGHAAFGDHAEIHVERQVITWLAGLLGFPEDAGGVLVSSGSVANLTALTVARDALIAGYLERGPRTGVVPVIYASAETHNSIDKAAGVLGLGREQLRHIPVDDGYRIVPAALDAAIAADRRAGFTPLCVVGNAGTVSTGAVDDIRALRAITSREGMWLHIDGCIGAALAFSPSRRHVLAGVELADSIAFDLHKWLHMPYDVGCVLIRDRARQLRSFSPPAAYLSGMPRGINAGGEPFGQLGLDLSRGFRALRVWFGLKEHGTERYGELVEQNLEQARYLASLVVRHPELELLAPVEMNIVCFRFNPSGPGLPDGALDELNREIVMGLHESGVAAPSYATLHGRFAIRVAIANHRSLSSDFDLLVDTVVTVGRTLLAG